MNNINGVKVSLFYVTNVYTDKGFFSYWEPRIENAPHFEDWLSAGVRKIYECAKKQLEENRETTKAHLLRGGSSKSEFWVPQDQLPHIDREYTFEDLPLRWQQAFPYKNAQVTIKNCEEIKAQKIKTMPRLGNYFSYQGLEDEILRFSEEDYKNWNQLFNQNVLLLIQLFEEGDQQARSIIEGIFNLESFSLGNLDLNNLINSRILQNYTSLQFQNDIKPLLSTKFKLAEIDLNHSQDSPFIQNIIRSDKWLTLKKKAAEIFKALVWDVLQLTLPFYFKGVDKLLIHKALFQQQQSKKTFTFLDLPKNLQPYINFECEITPCKAEEVLKSIEAKRVEEELSEKQRIFYCWLRVGIFQLFNPIYRTPPSRSTQFQPKISASIKKLNLTSFVNSLILQEKMEEVKKASQIFYSSKILTTLCLTVAAKYGEIAMSSYVEHKGPFEESYPNFIEKVSKSYYPEELNPELKAPIIY